MVQFMSAPARQLAAQPAMFGCYPAMRLAELPGRWQSAPAPPRSALPSLFVVATLLMPWAARSTSRAVHQAREWAVM